MIFISACGNFDSEMRNAKHYLESSVDWAKKCHYQLLWTMNCPSTTWMPTLPTQSVQCLKICQKIRSWTRTLFRWHKSSRMSTIYSLMKPNDAARRAGARSCVTKQEHSTDSVWIVSALTIRCVSINSIEIVGLFSGGIWGLVEGVRNPAGDASSKLRINSILNGCTLRGPLLGNTAGISCMFFAN